MADRGATGNADTGAIIRQTYLGLRLGILLLVVMLFLAVVIQALAANPACLQHSLSAYYYTSARAVFVGTLCAVGTCLIIYSGNTEIENLLLDYAGYMAVMVAFVPTGVDNTCTVSNVPTSDELTDAVKQNVLALLIAGLIAVVIVRALKVLQLNSRTAKVLLTVNTLILVGLAVFVLTSFENFMKNAHAFAAILFFAGVLAVVIVNAVGFARHKSGELGIGDLLRNRYTAIAAAMLITAGVLFALRAAGFGHWLLVLEASLIAEFAVFWISQTIELGGKVRRGATPRDAGGAQESDSELVAY
ncbi:hypothetical protein EV186_107183 [Labedaea rhizosphaerae]|uniref:Uncharacterized protein n=2 Tax=Labedaea rhizosphaerae TaxID=598644 RepID=A0A4V3CY61_LABRH|nr:hypothetical protein EV186_107183 [Labedaea rhizosphaerae]